MRRAALGLLFVLVTTSAHAQSRASGPDHHTVVHHYTAGPWVLFGTGLALFLGGLITELLSQPMSGNACSTCADPGPTDSARAGQIAGWIAVGTGAPMFVSGLVWHAVEARRITVAPSVTREGAAVVLRATF